MEPEDPWSAPTPALYDRMRTVLNDGTEAALATVVGVEGSAYRRHGAKMVIEPGGKSLGAITAGCLEGPVIDVAQSVVESGDSHLETYDLTNVDEWGLGMGCNGVIDVLVEPLDESWKEALDALEHGESVAVVTVLESHAGDVPAGARSVVGSPSETRVVEGRPPVGQVVLDAAKAGELAGTDGAETRTIETDDGTVEMFVDGLQPPADLLVWGWQRDVNPVVEFAARVGFRVTVASGRGGKAESEDFPAADRVVSTRPSELAEYVRNPDQTYAVVMSHSLIDDQLAVESLLDAGVPYVGLMGPRKRFEQLHEGLQADGRTLTEAELARIATPVGLDLGGGEPAQIALAIVAEALAVKNGREGGRLTHSKGPIHPRIESSQR